MKNKKPIWIIILSSLLVIVLTILNFIKEMIDNISVGDTDTQSFPTLISFFFLCLAIAVFVYVLYFISQTVLKILNK